MRALNAGCAVGIVVTKTLVQYVARAKFVGMFPAKLQYRDAIHEAVRYTGTFSVGD